MKNLSRMRQDLAYPIPGQNGIFRHDEPLPRAPFYFQYLHPTKSIAKHLFDTLENALPLLREISETDAGCSPAEGKRSSKEISGYLIDSATSRNLSVAYTSRA